MAQFSIHSVLPWRMRVRSTRALNSSWGGPSTHFLDRRLLYDRCLTPVPSQKGNRRESKKSLKIKEESPQPRGGKNSTYEQVK